MRNRKKYCSCGIYKVYSFGYTDEKRIKHTWPKCFYLVDDLITLEKKPCFCKKFDVDAYGFNDRKGSRHTWLDCYFRHSLGA